MEGPIWRELAPPAPPCPPLTDEVRAAVCVVGLGGSGLAALGELARRGVDAVGLDAGEVAAGAAGRNGGFLLAGLAAFHHRAVARLGRSRAAACHRATEEALAEMACETPDAIRLTGSLRIAADEAELEDCVAQFEAMRADGLEVERWSGPEGDGLLFPGDASLQPAARCRTLARSLLDAGTPMYCSSRVGEIAPGVVVTAGGRVECDAVLVCLDGGLERLVAEVAGFVRTARLQMLATAPVAGSVAARPVYRRAGYDYYQQLPSGEVVLGGGRDVGGEAEWTTEAVSSGPVQAYLERYLREGLGVKEAVTHRWAGAVSFTASGLPVVREVAPGLFVAGAYSGTGNVIGRICGRALVELALDGASKAAALFDGPDGRG